MSYPAYRTNGGHGAARATAARQRAQLVPEAEMTSAGTVKWYDAQRRYGFLTDEAGRDSFLHQSVLDQYGLKARDMIKGTPVRFKATERRPGLRPEVVAIAMA